MTHMTRSGVLLIGAVMLCAHAMVQAAPVDVVSADKTLPAAQSAGLVTCNVHVQLDDPADIVYSVAFSEISTDAPAGFHHTPSAMGGSDTAPQDLFLGIFPELAYDSYVTIGLKTVPIGVLDGTNTDGDFDSELFNSAGEITGGWYDQNYDQGLADENMQALVAQFTIEEGYQVSGTFHVFMWPVEDSFPLSFECFATSDCPADLNNDGVVNASDLALFLGGGWGPNPGHPGDFNDDGVINAADLALMLGAWGPC